MMLIVQYKMFSALRADETGVCMCIQSKLTYQTYNIIFLRASCGLRFTSLLILCGGDIDEMIDFKRKKLAWHGSIFVS